MLIGIISDTHDNVGHIIAATKLFIDKGVELVVHCGDIVAPASVPFFKGVKVWFVQGNCDGDVPMITRKAEEIGGRFLGDEAQFELGGKRFAVYHGQDSDRLGTMINSGKYDYVLTGHTHQQRNEMVGKTRVINPGAHYWHTSGTIALLDTGDGSVEFMEVENHG